MCQQQQEQQTGLKQGTHSVSQQRQSGLQLRMDYVSQQQQEQQQMLEARCRVLLCQGRI